MLTTFFPHPPHGSRSRSLLLSVGSSEEIPSVDQTKKTETDKNFENHNSELNCNQNKTPIFKTHNA